jgi:hypothetical protein
MTPALTVANMSKSFAGPRVLDSVSLSISANSRSARLPRVALPLRPTGAARDPPHAQSS